jgi:hypothetical protein
MKTRSSAYNHHQLAPHRRTQGSKMRNQVEIEDIAALRREVGIEDVELLHEIGLLKVGDLVRLTLQSASTPIARETLAVRITHVRGVEFRGTLTVRPASVGLSNLAIGSPVAFIRNHIHSIVKPRPARER